MKYCAKCNNLMLDRRPSCLRCGNESPSTVSQKLHGFTEAHPVSGDDTRREIVSGTFFSSHATMGHEAFRFRAGLRVRFLFPSLEEGCNGVDGDREDGG
jgi:hypothetical protein